MLTWRNPRRTVISVVDQRHRTCSLCLTWTDLFPGHSPACVTPLVHADFSLHVPSCTPNEHGVLEYVPVRTKTFGFFTGTADFAATIDGELRITTPLRAGARAADDGAAADAAAVRQHF
jgi:hypothetical protein